MGKSKVLSFLICLFTWLFGYIGAAELVGWPLERDKSSIDDVAFENFAKDLSAQAQCKFIKLSGVKSVTKIPDLSKFVNLRVLDLSATSLGEPSGWFRMFKSARPINTAFLPLASENFKIFRIAGTQLELELKNKYLKKYVKAEMKKFKKGFGKAKVSKGLLDLKKRQFESDFDEIINKAERVKVMWLLNEYGFVVNKPTRKSGGKKSPKELSIIVPADVSLQQGQGREGAEEEESPGEVSSGEVFEGESPQGSLSPGEVVVSKEEQQAVFEKDPLVRALKVLKTKLIGLADRLVYGDWDIEDISREEM
jgi:hypothetical protein